MQQRYNFRQLSKTHLLLTSIVLVVGAVCIILIATGLLAPFNKEADRDLQLIAIVFSLLCGFFGWRSFRSSILAARNSEGAAEEKMRLYGTACKRWWALHSGPANLAFCFLLVTGNYAFAVLGGVHLLVLLLFKPRKESIKLFLQLSEEDVAPLER